MVTNGLVMAFTLSAGLKIHPGWSLALYFGFCEAELYKLRRLSHLDSDNLKRGLLQCSVWGNLEIKRRSVWVISCPNVAYTDCKFEKFFSLFSRVIVGLPESV